MRGCLGSQFTKEAGALNAEAVIAVTDDDEVNIFSSLLAKILGVKDQLQLLTIKIIEI